MARIPTNGAELFHLSETNPNPSGGCACSEARHSDTHGPFVVFNNTVLDSGISPHVVVCAPCCKQAVVSIEGKGTKEILRVGEAPRDPRQDEGPKPEPDVDYHQQGPGSETGSPLSTR